MYLSNQILDLILNKLDFDILKKIIIINYNILYIILDIIKRKFILDCERNTEKAVKLSKLGFKAKLDLIKTMACRNDNNNNNGIINNGIINNNCINDFKSDLNNIIHKSFADLSNIHTVNLLFDFRYNKKKKREKKLLLLKN